MLLAYYFYSPKHKKENDKFVVVNNQYIEILFVYKNETCNVFITVLKETPKESYFYLNVIYYNYKIKCYPENHFFNDFIKNYDIFKK